MELTCACILFIVGFVTASPYGYGTKGGASAKAEASAVAGAGGIPASIPSGAGYSGSYSKSSASSFASSSASSSASSFSYGGSGTLTYPGGNSGAIPSGSGCGSGACQDAGKGYNPSTTIPSASGCGSGACQDTGKGYNPSAAGSQSYSNNAGYTGTGSAGYGNNYNTNNVNGENYGHSPSDKTTDCGSGGCQPGKVVPLAIGSNSYSQDNSVAGTTGSGYAKGPSGTDSGCSNGNCGPSGSDDKDKNESGTKKCTTGYCDNTPQTGSNAPYYSNENKCASGNCESVKENDSSSDDIAVPKSNYGSRIHFNDNPPNYGCANGNCGSSNSKPLYSQPAPISEPTKCNTPGCSNYGQSSPSYSDATAAAGYNKPSTHLTAPKEDAPCTTPNCQGSPVISMPSYNSYSPNYNTPNPVTSPSGGNSPSYNGYTPGSNTPVPVTSPEANSHSYIGFPPYNPQQTVTSPGANPPSCIGGTCNSQNKGTYYVSPNYGSVTLSSANSPSCIGGTCNGQNKAPYPASSNYGSRPPIPTGSGCTTPNCGSINPSPNCAGGNCGPAIGPHDNIGFNGQPSYNTHYSHGNTPNNSPASPAVQGCGPNSPNCGPIVGPSGYYSTSPHPFTASAGPSSYKNPTNSYRPPSPVGQPGYGITGPYDGGLLNVPSQPSNSNSVASSGLPSNGYYKPGSAGLGSYQSGPGYTPQNTAPSSGPGLNTGSYSSPGYGGYTAPSGPSGPNNCNTPGCSNPAISNIASAQAGAGNLPKPADEDKPAYTGGFGGPAGVLKPNEFDVSSPTAKPVLSPVASPSKPNCVSGNCGHKDQPAYTGGFGAPAGVLKPNEFDVSSPTAKPVLSPVASPSKPSCVSPNCGNPSVGSPPSYSHNGANSGAAASANAVAYTGGFGGPPGFLKPYDDGKIDLPIGKQISHNGINNDHYSNSNPGNESVEHSGAQAHSAAQASAVAGASSGYKSGGCGGGCGDNNGGGASFGPTGSNGLSKSGYADGSSGSLNIANASAKSIASADGGNLRGGYAGSSASAHASAGIKSSYGKR